MQFISQKWQLVRWKALVSWLRPFFFFFFFFLVSPYQTIEISLGQPSPPSYQLLPPPLVIIIYLQLCRLLLELLLYVSVAIVSCMAQLYRRLHLGIRLSSRYSYRTLIRLRGKSQFLSRRRCLCRQSNLKPMICSLISKSLRNTLTLQRWRYHGAAAE